MIKIILQARKVELFYPQKWYSNRTGKTLCDVMLCVRDQSNMAKRKK